MRPCVTASALAGVAFLAACAGLLGVDDVSYSTPDGGGPDGAAADSAAAADAPGADALGADAGPHVDDSGCPTGRGATMVRVPVGASRTACVDSTETTRAHYRTFLASVVEAGAPKLRPECDFKVGFLPDRMWPPSSGEDSLPVVGVDWCDAVAFCTWAGKRLCGAPGGGPVPFDVDDDSEWFLACSAGGNLAYSYGNTYDPSACNDNQHGANAALPVATLSKCTGGYRASTT